MTSISQTNPPVDVDSISLPLEWRITNFKQMMTDRKKGPVYSNSLSHESLPGITWQLKVYPYEKVDKGHAIGCFLCRTFRVYNGDTLLNSNALCATAALDKLHLKSSDGRVSLDEAVAAQKFGFSIQGWGLSSLWSHETAEKYCETNDGSLTICAEITVHKYGNRHDEFARRVLATGEYSDLSLDLDSKALDPGSPALFEIPGTMAADEALQLERESLERSATLFGPGQESLEPASEISELANQTPESDDELREFDRESLETIDESLEDDNLSLESGSPILLRSTFSQTLRLHRLIISFASPLLADLVQRGALGDVRKGRSKESVVTLVLYLYGYPLWFKDLPQLACEVLVLAEWFGLSELKDLCLTGFSETLTVPNCLENYSVGAERNLEPIKLAAIEFIYQQLPALLKTEEWKNVKADSPSRAMEICEQLFLKMSEQDLEPARKKKKTDASSLRAGEEPALPKVHTAPEKVKLSWLIPEFKKLLSSDSSDCVVCPESFKLDAYPGISWTVVLHPKGKSGSKDSVGVYVRQMATSTKKSPATGLAIGFTLALHRPNSGAGSLSTQATNAFHCGADSEIGLDDFCKRALAESRCDRHGALTLSGHFTAEVSPSPLLTHLRRSFESGADSDFKVIFGTETFAVHKAVLTRSPKISAMLATPCTETEKAALTIQAETSADAVKAMLQFWYDEPLLFDGLPDLSMEVLILAAFLEEYQDWDLVKICESALQKMVDEENVLDFAALAFRHKAPDLAKATVSFLAARAETLLRHDNETWGKLKDANLELALEIADAVLNDDASLRQ